MRDYKLFLLLHAVLKPPILAIRKKDIKRTKWKPSIIDSQESCIIYCLSASQYMSKIDQLKQKYLQKGLTFQPVMIVIGEGTTDLKSFFCYYDGILYKFNSFLKCLDVSFKLFHVMNFEYPKEAQNVYNFIETFFYNFKTEVNCNVSNILQILKES